MLQGLRADSFPLGGNKPVYVLRLGEEGIDPPQFVREHIAPALPLQDMPHLPQASFFTPLCRRRSTWVLRGKDSLGPVKGGETKAGFLAMGYCQCP